MKTCEIRNEIKLLLTKKLNCLMKKLNFDGGKFHFVKLVSPSVRKIVEDFAYKKMSCYVNLLEGGWKCENPHNKTFLCIQTHHFFLIF